MTRQTEDKLIYKNHEFYIRNEISLENYICSIFRPSLGMFCSACHRGYFATFQVRKDNRLYLIELNNECVNKPLYYTGELTLIDGFDFVNDGNTDFPILSIQDNHVLKLLFENGFLQGEKTISKII